MTFLQSRYARELESTSSDFYQDVYFAARPELFLKASPGTAVGPGAAVGVRADSAWNVPEPELGLVVDASGSVVAFTVGVVLLCGTSIVPPPEFTRQPGDQTSIDIPGVGTLVNGTQLVGSAITDAPVAR